MRKSTPPGGQNQHILVLDFPKKKGYNHSMITRIFIRYMCMPLILIGAMSYSAMALFDTDIMTWFFNPGMVRLIHVMVGIAGISIITNNIVWDRAGEQNRRGAY